MPTNSSEIKAAVDLMDPADVVDGVPKLEVVQRIAGDTTITAEAVAAAIGKAKPKVETIIASTPPDGGANGAAHSLKADPDADKEDNTDKPVDPNDIKRAKAAEAEAELVQVQTCLDQLSVQREQLATAIKNQDKRKSELETIIEANTVQFSDAEMVKRVQAQTQERLMRQAEARAKVAGVMDVAGVRTFASALDQALANGNKRSKVIQEGGKVFEAPHPRSPDGVRAFGNWVHRGQNQNA